MIKLMKYLKKSAGYIVLIIALLFLQAYCDLSLPDYTSKIINVGIQQKGIEDSVPDKLRDSTLQNLQIFMDEDQKKEVSQNYTQEDDTWLLNDDISKETRENLNEDFSKAMMMVAAFSEDSEQGQAMAAQMGLPEGTDPLTALAQMPEEAVQQIMSQMDEKLKDMLAKQAKKSFEKVFDKKVTMGLVGARNARKEDNRGRMQPITKVTMKMHHPVREDLLRYLQSNITA